MMAVVAMVRAVEAETHVANKPIANGGCRAREVGRAFPFNREVERS
jgi:hypothetical protein